MTWIAPNQGGSPITEWKVEIRNKKGLFVTLLQCKTKLQFCEVSMDTLESEPYGLVPGDFIVARVSAKNSYGYSDPSLPNENGPKLYGKPVVPEMPDLELESDNFFVLRWNPILRAANTEIFMSNLKTGEGKVIGKTNKTKFTVTKVDKNQTYIFKIRGVNECGQGLWSPELKLSIIFAPGRMVHPDVKLIPAEAEKTGCGLNLTWNTPISNGSPITKYEIEVKGSKGLWHILKDCGKTKVKSCNFPVSTLM